MKNNWKWNHLQREYRAENVLGSLIATRLTKVMLVASPQFFRLHLYFLSNYDAFFILVTFNDYLKSKFTNISYYKYSKQKIY
jgi:hypothetical protein